MTFSLANCFYGKFWPDIIGMIIIIMTEGGEVVKTYDRHVSCNYHYAAAHREYG